MCIPTIIYFIYDLYSYEEYNMFNICDYYYYNFSTLKLCENAICSILIINDKCMLISYSIVEPLNNNVNNNMEHIIGYMCTIIPQIMTLLLILLFYLYKVYKNLTFKIDLCLDKDIIKHIYENDLNEYIHSLNI